MLQFLYGDVHDILGIMSKEKGLFGRGHIKKPLLRSAGRQRRILFVQKCGLSSGNVHKGEKRNNFRFLCSEDQTCRESCLGPAVLRTSIGTDVNPAR